MSKVQSIAEKRQEPSQNAIDNARELLQRCESGEVQGFTACLEKRGGFYEIFGSEIGSRTSMAGKLLEAAITRLGFGGGSSEEVAS